MTLDGIDELEVPKESDKKEERGEAEMADDAFLFVQKKPKRNKTPEKAKGVLIEPLGNMGMRK